VVLVRSCQQLTLVELSRIVFWEELYNVAIDTIAIGPAFLMGTAQLGRVVHLGGFVLLNYNTWCLYYYT